MAIITGNRPFAHGNRGGMAGSSVDMAPFGWVSIAGDINEVVIIDAASIPLKYGATNLGCFFQSEVNATLDFTLCHPSLAKNPDAAAQLNVLWGSTKSVTPKDITGVLFPFTAVRIKFAAKGILYIGAM